jgi:hypothetical protein
MLVDNWEYKKVDNYKDFVNRIFSLRRINSFEEVINTKGFYDGQVFFNFDFEFTKDNQIEFVMRSSNATYGHMRGDLENKIWKGYFHFNKLTNLEIVDNRLTSLIAEDPRFFYFKGKKYILVHNVVNPMTMIMYDVEEEYFTILKDPLNRGKTKNWIPYSSEDSLKFITDILPTRVYDYKTKNFEQYDQNAYFRVSGSSRMFEIDGIKTAIVHGWRTDIGQNRFGWPHKYWNAIAQWDDLWNLRIYDPFYMADDFSVEFSTGFQIKDDKVFFGYTVLDKEIHISSISLKDFKNYCFR